MAICDDFVFTDAILGKKWHFQEVQQLMVSQLATMPGNYLVSMVICYCLLLRWSR